MRARRYVTIALAAGLAACGGGGASSPGSPTDPGGGGGGGGARFANLTMSPSSGTVTVGGSFQVTATPVDASGAAVSGLAAPRFESSDASRATVNANGLVTGVAAGAVTIRAILTAEGVTDTATAALTVSPTAPPPPPAATFTTLSISPDAGALGVGATLQLTATPRDQTGAAMAGLPAATFTTSSAGIAPVSAAGLVRGVSAGPVTITASVTSGGVTRAATAALTVTAPALPTTASVQALRDGFSPGSVTIAVGGTVTWTMADDDHTVTFTGNAPAGGSIPRTEEGESASRTFAVAGVYSYRCDRHDETGTVEVKTQTTTPTNPVFTSLTLSPSTGSVQVGSTLTLTATPRDQLGNAMAGLGTPQFSTSSASTATVSATGVVTGVAAGTATITATLASGGTTRTATATITVTTTAPPPPPPDNPSTATVSTPGESFSPQTVTIAAGGSVTWNISGATHNVTFNGAAPTGGNIPDTRGASATRTFPTAGTYSYQCTRHDGMTGQVVVQQ
jgi:plastocyanin